MMKNRTLLRLCDLQLETLAKLRTASSDSLYGIMLLGRLEGITLAISTSAEEGE